MNIKHYTYRITWSPEGNEHLGLCAGQLDDWAMYKDIWRGKVKL